MRSALNRVVTLERFDRLSYSSLDQSHVQRFGFGLLILVLSCFMLCLNEEDNLLHEHIIAEATRSSVELACDGGGREPVDPQQLVHLTDCPVSNSLHISASVASNASHDVAETLRPFEENFPSEGVSAAWFQVHVKVHGRRRSTDGYEWHEFGAINNLKSTRQVAEDMRIGSRHAGSEMVGAFPSRDVQLSQSLSYQDTWQGDGIFSSHSNESFSSRNMHVEGNRLYTGDPSSPADGDVMLYFTAGEVFNSVSVMGANDASGRLVAWKTSQGEGYDVARVEEGSVSLRAMISQLSADYIHEAKEVRIALFVFIWIGIYALLFIDHWFNWFDSMTLPNFFHAMVSCGLRAPLIALFPWGIGIGFSWLVLHHTLPTCATAMVLVPLLLAAALGRVPACPARSGTVGTGMQEALVDIEAAPATPRRFGTFQLLALGALVGIVAALASAALISVALLV